MPKVNGKYIIPYSIGIESEVIVPNCVGEETLNYWDTTSDPSIDEYGEGCGVEYYSSILYDSNIQKALRELEKHSRKHNFKVNKTCGVHIHIGTPWAKKIRLIRRTRDEYGEGCGNDERQSFYKGWQKNKKVAALYAALEPLVFALVSDSRINNSMTYPLTMMTSASNIINMSTKDFVTFLFGKSIYLASCRYSVSKFGEFANYRGFNTRYIAINFNASLYHGTIEFRMHGASTSAKKIYHWVKFLSSIVEASQTFNKNRFSAQDIYNPRKVFEKILNLDESTTEFLLQRLKQLSSGNMRLRIANKKSKIKRMRRTDPYSKLKQVQLIIHKQAIQEGGLARILDKMLKSKLKGSQTKMFLINTNLIHEIVEEKKLVDCLHTKQVIQNIDAHS